MFDKNMTVDSEAINHNYFDSLDESCVSVKQDTQLGLLTVIINPNDGNLFFVGKEVASSLGYYDKSGIIKILDKSSYNWFSQNFLNKIKDLEVNLGQPIATRGMVLISEPGIYHLLEVSGKPFAEEFRKQVNEGILPTIRKTGQYGTTNNHIDSEILATLKLVSSQVTCMAEELAKLRPIGEYFNIAITQSPDWIDIAEVARLLNTKHLGVDPNFPTVSTITLLNALRSQGYIYKNHSNNIPMQCYVDAGLMAYKFTEVGKPSSTLFNKNNLVWLVGVLKRAGIYPLASDVYNIKNQHNKDLNLLNTETNVKTIQ